MILNKSCGCFISYTGDRDHLKEGECRKREGERGREKGERGREKGEKRKGEGRKEPPVTPTSYYVWQRSILNSLTSWYSSIYFQNFSNLWYFILLCRGFSKHNIYIFIAFALDETSILVTVYFSMQNIYQPIRFFVY